MLKRIVSALGQRKSLSTSDLAPESPRDVYSCYEGGTRGVCSVCTFPKIKCNCQRCRSCNAFMMTLRSRHHCRVCWRPFCPNCSRKQRVTSFTGGGKPQPSRACNTCAVPQGLIHLSGMFDNYGSPRKLDTTTTDSGEDSQDRLGRAAQRFRWGLYALLSCIDAPRRCTNPSCTVYLSYDSVCAKCKMPTVTCALHEVRSVDVNAPSADRGLICATEAAVGEHHSMKAKAMAACDLNVVYGALLPNRAESFALHGLRGNAWGARKVLLSRIAVGIAGEGRSCPNISLAMSAAPDARLLHIVRVEPTYTVLAGPGATRLYAFTPTTGRKALERRLANILCSRQVWATDSSQCIGVVCKSDSEAKARGGTQLVGEFCSPQSLLLEVETSSSLVGVRDEMLKLMQEGVDLVLCGFSTGGSVASLLSALLLLESTSVARERLLCVTYGAPLVGNKGLTDILEAGAGGSLCANFHHFVKGSDVLPRMAFLPTFLQTGTMGSVALSEEGVVDIQDDPDVAVVRDQIICWLSANLQRAIPAEQQRALSKKPKRSKKSLTKDKTGTPSRDKDSTDGSDGTSGSDPSKSRRISSDSDDDDEYDVSFSDPLMAAGDIFAQSREPFDNNYDSMRTTVTEAGEVSSPSLTKTDTSSFETLAYRSGQLLDPFGCYNILWRGQDMYTYSSDPVKTLAILTQRDSMRVLLKDHLLPSYDRAITEYLNATA